MNWHYADNGKQVGPVTEEELLLLLQTGQINEATLVWQPGLPNWVPYRQVQAPTTPAPAESPKLTVENPADAVNDLGWHYEDRGRQTGPVKGAELRQLVQAGRIDDNTLVWRSGLPDWVPYRQVKPAANPAPQPSASLKLTPGAESSTNNLPGTTHKWHYEENGQQAGPVTDEQLRRLLQAGRIDAETLVWHPGMSNWLPYRQAQQPQPETAPPSNARIGTEPEVVCAECGRMFPTSETIRHGKARVCATCKPIFLQKLSEGASLHRRTDRGGGLRAGEMAYAGFWIRFAAQFLDGLIIGAVNFGIGLIARLILFQTASGMPAEGKMPAALLVLQLILIAINVAIALTYEGVLVGKYGATLGKMACNIIVVRADGGKVGYGLAFGRYFAKLLSTLTCCIGYIMAGFDGEKRALHDHVCGTRVIYK